MMRTERRRKFDDFREEIYKRDPKGSRSRRAVSLTRQEKQHKATFGGESTWWWVIFDWLENVSYSQRAYSRISHYVCTNYGSTLGPLNFKWFSSLLFFYPFGRLSYTYNFCFVCAPPIPSNIVRFVSFVMRVERFVHTQRREAAQKS